MLVAVWRVRLGRVTLYLLDTDLEENAPWDRELSARLYGGDRETRIQQEIILGIGGVRALKALGVDPAVFHLNEGHAGFVVLQRIRDLIEHGLDASTRRSTRSARRRCSRRTRRCRPGTTRFRSAWSRSISPAAGARSAPTATGSSRSARYDNGGGMQFNMTALAMRSAGAINAVSQLHGEVTRAMWAPMWPDVPEAERPVVVGHQRRARADLDRRATWPTCSRRTSAPTGSSGTTIRRCGTACSRFPTRSCGRCGSRCGATCSRSSASARGSAGSKSTSASPRVVAAGTLLEPEALTIGFARRFTGYKRPELCSTIPSGWRGS